MSNRSLRKSPHLLLLNDDDQDVECDLELERQEVVLDEPSYESDDVEAML